MMFPRTSTGYNWIFPVSDQHWSSFTEEAECLAPDCLFWLTTGPGVLFLAIPAALTDLIYCWFRVLYISVHSSYSWLPQSFSLHSWQRLPYLAANSLPISRESTSSSCLEKDSMDVNPGWINHGILIVGGTLQVVIIQVWHYAVFGAEMEMKYDMMKCFANCDMTLHIRNT